MKLCSRLNYFYVVSKNSVVSVVTGEIIFHVVMNIAVVSVVMMKLILIWY